MPSTDEDTFVKPMVPPIARYVVREAREVSRESRYGRSFRHVVQQEFEHIAGTVLTVNCVLC